MNLEQHRVERGEGPQLDHVIQQFLVVFAFGVEARTLKELVQNLEVLGAATIVGGVEDVKTMPILWSLGVDLLQGFFLQHPYREMSYDFAGAAF